MPKSHVQATLLDALVESRSYFNEHIFGLRMEYDDLLKVLGRSGRYEKLIVFVIAIPVLFHGFTNIGMVFVAGVPEHWCHVPDLNNFNLTEEQIRLISIPLKDGKDSFDSCTMYDRNYSGWTEADVAVALEEGSHATDLNVSTIKCPNGWYYDQSVYTSTIVSQWDLVCGDQWLRSTSFSVYAIGCMIGALCIGSLADAIGRKPAFCLSLLLRALSALLLAFAPNYIVFIILRISMATFQTGVYTVGFVAVLEFVAPPWRVHAGLASGYIWVVSYMLTAGAGYLMRDWSTFQWTTSLPAFIFVAYICFLPESPRWLYTKNKRKKADKIVQEMARFNKVVLPEKMEIVVKSNQTKRYYVWDTLRTPRMRFRSLVLFFIWMVNSMVYYGLSYNTSNLGGDVYLNAFIAGAVEAPGYLIPHFTMSYFGRRATLCGAMLIGGLALISIIFVPEGMTWLVITLATVGKGCITASFLAVYVISAEMYPTVIRNIGVGSGSFCARVGSFIAPYLSELGTANMVIPPLIFGTASIAAGLMTMLLPETKGRNLPETIRDAEEFAKGSVPCRSCYDRCCKPANQSLDDGRELSELPESSMALNPDKPTEASSACGDGEGRPIDQSVDA